jgi:mannose-6-phosphate isomerase-like protein (cupin superfamily)
VNPRHRIGQAALAAVLASGVAIGAQEPRASISTVIAPGAGERIPCGDGSAITLKVKRDTTPSGMLAGVAEVTRPTTDARQPRADQIVMITDGWGEAIAGGRTIQLGPGSVVRVPPGVARRFTPRGSEPLRYFFVLGGEAEDPCGSGGTSSGAEGVVAIEPGEGERIFYCLFPMTLTAKIDTDSAPGSSLTLAAGQLRAGREYATHPGTDELVYTPPDPALAVVGTDLVTVERGSMVINPRGTYHEFVAGGSDTLDYAVIFSDSTGRAGFRGLARRPGPYCPAEVK